MSEISIRSINSARAISDGSLQPEYRPWRHGGWYVTNLWYPNGAVGCVARTGNGLWVIACDGRRESPTFRNRDEAARAEAALILAKAIDAMQPQGPITVGVLVEAGVVTEIRATQPEITH